MDSNTQTSPSDPENSSDYNGMDFPKTKPVELLPTPGRGTLWLIAISVVYVIATTLYGVAYAIYALSMEEPPESITDQLLIHLTQMNGISGTYIAQFVLLFPLLLLISHFKEQNWKMTLALTPVPWDTIAKWLGVWAAYQATAFVFSYFVEIPESEFTEMMKSGTTALSAFVIVGLAPILEETVFRGYLFKAWRHSWLGAHGTILVTSILFSLIHAGQYHWTAILLIFALAQVLGYAREKTGSLVPAIAIHMANNLFATIAVQFT